MSFFSKPLSGKRLMVIGSVWSPEPLVAAAKELGCWVLATHYGRNPEKITADEARALYPKDIAAAVKLFKQYRIEGVIHDSDDDALFAAGILCNKFDLPGPSLNAVVASTNKKRLRATWEDLLKNKIRQPPYYTGSTLNDIYIGVERVGNLPAVVKPIDGQWGRGVSKVETEDRLQEAYFEALTYSPSREFIIEKFVPGRVIIVDSFSFDRETHISLAIASKRIWPGGELLTAGLVYPAEIDSDLYQEAFAQHKLATRTLHYDFGLSHSEFIVDENKNFWLLESTNRGSGYFISSLLLPALTGLELRKQLVGMAFGKIFPQDLGENLFNKHAAVFSNIWFNAGRVKAINGVKEACSIPRVLSCKLFFGEGETIPAGRYGSAIIVGDTPDQVKQIEQRVRQLVQIEYF